MLAQRLRHRITLQEKIEAQSSATGEIETDWIDILFEEPAEVVPKSAREFFASASKQGETSGRITIRKPDIAINSAMRVLWDGVPYQIDGVLPDPSNARWLTILYSEGVNDGE